MRVTTPPALRPPFGPGGARVERHRQAVVVVLIVMLVLVRAIPATPAVGAHPDIAAAQAVGRKPAMSSIGRAMLAVACWDALRNVMTGK